MSFENHRRQLMELIEDGSIVLSFAGLAHHNNEDSYAPFTVNSQFFYLTGLKREKMALLLMKQGETKKEILFIEEWNPDIERWTGKMPTKEDVTKVSGVTDVRFVDSFWDTVGRMMNYGAFVDHAYMDLSKDGFSELSDYNFLMAEKFMKCFPQVKMHDLHRVCMPLRQTKDADEVEDIKKAIEITDNSLQLVMSILKPGLMEYQVQAAFEYACKKQGATELAFDTIAGSGINGCMMHYEENSSMVKEDGLILLDLGAKYNHYSADITRTYPVSGKYSERQRAYYDLVLAANKAVIEAAKPGLTLNDLQEIAKKVLAEGLIRMGKIEKEEDVTKYYMHSVSHSLGIDTHDIELRTEKLMPGWVITDEPGLYIDEEEIGIRIEDDVIITATGSRFCGDKVIPYHVDELEEYMANRK